MCLGQKNGIKHAIHALRLHFLKDLREIIFMIYARNEFNNFNRDLDLKTSINSVPQFLQQSETLIRPHQTFLSIKG